MEQDDLRVHVGANEGQWQKPGTDCLKVAQTSILDVKLRFMECKTANRDAENWLTKVAATWLGSFDVCSFEVTVQLDSCCLIGYRPDIWLFFLHREWYLGLWGYTKAYQLQPNIRGQHKFLITVKNTWWHLSIPCTERVTCSSWGMVRLFTDTNQGTYSELSCRIQAVVYLESHVSTTRMAAPVSMAAFIGSWRPEMITPTHGQHACLVAL